MNQQWKTCSCTSVSLAMISTLDEDSDHSRKLTSRLHRFFIFNVPFMVPLAYSVLVKMKNPVPSTVNRHLPFEADDDLNPGDLVLVRSEEEIRSTLNEKNKFKGLGVMPEMADFYGKEFRVFKKLNKIMIEATGEMRNIKTPTYLLEGVFCDGKYHNGCDRSCFLLWKREWLIKVK